MYGRHLYIEREHPVSEGKNVSVSFRVSPRFKQLLEAAASRDHRSLTNMLETLLFAHCEQNGIEVADSTKQTGQSPQGEASK